MLPAIAAAQLAPGDIVVLGIDVVNDKITFATLVDIPGGTQIKITDNGWNNATNTFTTAITADGIATWTPPTKVDAGSVFSLRFGGTNPANNNLTNITANMPITSQAVFTGHTSATNTMVPTGEQVFIYQGTETNPFFIYGMNASHNVNLDPDFWQTTITITGIQSMLPNGAGGSQNALINGVNAIGVLTNPSNTTTTANQQFDNVFYNGPTSWGTGLLGWRV